MISDMRYRHVALGIILLAASGLAMDQAHAQEPPQVLFSAMPDDMDDPPSSLDARSSYQTASEMVVLNTDALQSDSPISVTIFGHTYTISRDSVETRGNDDYTWFGSGDQIPDAILVVNGTQASGLIYTATKTFEILPVSASIHEIYDLDVSKFPPVGSGQTNLARSTHTPLNMSMISQLASAYVGWQDYDRGRAETVTIDVFMIVTNNATNHYGGSTDQMVHLAISNANIVYEENDLPIVLNLVDYHEVSGYDDAGDIETDLDNLMDPNNRAFVRPQALLEKENVDVAIMMVGDYEYDDDDNNDKRNTCGIAHDHLVNDKSTSFGAVESVCIGAQSFTHVIGLMQGAGQNVEDEPNTEFSYGHGYYHAGVDRRTIMSQSAGNCNDPRTELEEVCYRKRIWSDPHRYFFGTATPAGTADSWNSRVVFATAPHIASLRGPAQTYDSVAPTGSIELPSTLPTRGTLNITATFSEPIHEWYPPIITITDGTETTTAVMTRSTGTEYTYPHMLDGEDGTVQLLFSNARDAFGNLIEKNPTSGGTFSINARDITPPPLPPSVATSVSEPFDGSLSRWHLWSLPNDGAWDGTYPLKGVPDTPQDTNQVISSNNCEDSCIATLRSTLNTLEPLVITFDRYVDEHVNNREGLFVEYSVDDGTTWITLASYTGANDKDTSRWEKSVLGLSISESSAKFRLHAKSDQTDEYVEVDNLRIFRPSAAVPDATFSATLNSDLTRIVLLFSQTVPQSFSPYNFTLSHGNVTGVSGSNSNIRILDVTGVPFDTAVLVTYVGDTISLDSDTRLRNGISDTTNAVTSTLDTTRPTITAPSDRTFEATGARTTLTAEQIGTPDVDDAIDPNPTVFNNAPPDGFQVKTTTVTWTARDASGNTATDTQRITVQDTTPPAFTFVPPNRSFTTTEATIVLTEEHYGTATARDDVDPSPTITNDVTNPFNAGETTTITWTAEDMYHNSDTAQQFITVIQSSLRITAPDDITVEATGPTMSVDIGTANATHDTDTELAISNNATATSFPVGTTTILWTVVDSSGVTATDAQIITVQDTTDPVFDPVTNLDFVFDPDVPIVIHYDSPAATDIADDSVAVVCTPASGTMFGEGATVVACTATDDAGNTANATFDVSVLVFSTTIFHDDFETGDLAGWNATDYIDTWDSYLPEGGVNPPDHPAANKVAQVSWCDITCTMSISGFDLSVQAEPEFLQFYRYVDDELDDGEYLSLELYDGTAWTELDRWTPEESDNDDVWHLEEYSLSNYTGVTDFGMRFTAVMSSIDEVVAIDDVRIFILPPPAPPSNATALAITAPADVTAEATGATTQVNTGTATASGGSGNYTITSNATNPFPLGATAILWTAMDSNNMSATDSQIVTVRDTTAPAFTTAPADISRSFPTRGITEVAFATPPATDAVDSDVSVSCVPASGTEFQPGNTTVTCTATDDHFNSATASFTVSVTVGEVRLYPPIDMEAKATDSEIVLTWRAPYVVAADSYQILRDSGSGMVVLVNDTQSTDAAFVDYAAAPGTSYSYQVKAITPHGLSPSSSIVTATPHQAGILDLRAVTTANSTTLNWDYTGNATGYVILKTDGHESLVIHDIRFVSAHEHTYTDTLASANDTYVYHILVQGENTYPRYDYYDFVEVTVE